MNVLTVAELRAARLLPPPPLWRRELCSQSLDPPEPLCKGAARSLLSRRCRGSGAEPGEPRAVSVCEHLHAQVSTEHPRLCTNPPCPPAPGWNGELRGARPALPAPQGLRTRGTRGAVQEARTHRARHGAALGLPGRKARDALLNCTVGRASVEAVGGTDVPGRNSTLSKHGSSPHARHPPWGWTPALHPSGRCSGLPARARSRHGAQLQHSPAPPI